MCVFFNTTFNITRLIAIILVPGSILFIFWNLRKKSYADRILFWKIPHKPFWKKLLKSLFYIIPSVIITTYWYLFIHPLLSDITPLTAGWVTLGIFSWGIISVATAMFPRIRSKKID
jgi:hypothetical protein